MLILSLNYGNYALKHEIEYWSIACQYKRLQKLTGYGLFTELDHSKWKQQRRTISHAFSNLNIRHQIPILQQKLMVMIQKFHEKATTQQVVSNRNIMQFSNNDAVDWSW